MKKLRIKSYKLNYALTLLCTIYSSTQCVDTSDQAMHLDTNVGMQKKLIELSSAHILSRAIHVAACMNIADHLVSGSCHINDLASKVGANSDALYRLLRLLASYEIFYEDEARNFSLTPLAQLLVSNHPDSLQAWLAYHDGDEKRWRAYGHMDYSIEIGKPAFNNIYGQGYFDMLAQDPSMAASFDEGMRNLSEKEDMQIAASYDFYFCENITDIGGGKGGLLASIMKSNCSMHGILYDLPHVQISAQSYLIEQKLEARIICESGSFFDKVPSGSDVYVLKRILHDWDDELCIKILSNCRSAMKQDAKLLIIEAVVAPRNNRDFAKDIDVAMLVLFGGKERTLDEWQILLTVANLKLVGVHATPSMLSIIEVVVDDRAIASQTK